MSNGGGKSGLVAIASFFALFCCINCKLSILRRRGNRICVYRRWRNRIVSRNNCSFSDYACRKTAVCRRFACAKLGGPVFRSALRPVVSDIVVFVFRRNTPQKRIGIFTLCTISSRWWLSRNNRISGKILQSSHYQTKTTSTLQLCD